MASKARYLAALKDGHKFRFSGIIRETDYHHSTSIHDQSGHLIAPIYIEVPSGKMVPCYHETVYGNSTEYDPKNNCDGMFMSSKFQPNNNCYNYAVNIATSSFAQPGRMTGADAHSFEGFGEEFVVGAVSDGLILVSGDPVAFLKTQRTGQGHLVALLISMPIEEIGWPGDFHWVRCDNTWSDERIWSQKDGGDQMTNFDYAGNKIYNPEVANWTVNEGRMGTGEEDVVIEYKFKTYMFVPSSGVRII